MLNISFQERVYGLAYEIGPEKEQAVREHLDYREKGGYVAHSVTFNPRDQDIEPFSLDIYIGTEDNPYFLGPPPCLKDLARQIYHSVGPSGPNTEYLFNLADSVRKEFPDIADPHLFELEREVKNMCANSKTR